MVCDYEFYGQYVPASITSPASSTEPRVLDCLFECAQQVTCVGVVYQTASQPNNCQLVTTAADFNNVILVGPVLCCAMYDVTLLCCDVQML